MEIGSQILRQSILSWKIVKMLVRKGATCLSITALTEKNVRIVTGQQNAVFLMINIFSCLQISTTIPLTDRDLMINFFGTIRCRQIYRASRRPMIKVREYYSPVVFCSDFQRELLL